jgi:hypothetical protein
MANPTSNFGWQMPTSSDLVTDLPADFETFGQAVDTSLADLKGGTTGQILSKNSNTDMDFTWIANDQGDITAVTAGTGITGGGTSGAVTVSFDVANYGGGQYAAGKNKTINADFSTWQRGTSIAVTASTYTYTTDRWLLDSGNTCTVSRQSTNDTTNLAFIQYCARVQRNSGQTSTTNVYFTQCFETANSRGFSGKTVTLSFYARAGANFSATSNALKGQVITGTGTDQNVRSGSYTGQATALDTDFTLTTTWQRFTTSGTIAATANELAITFRYTPTGTAGANDYFEVTGVQLEVGSTATPFQTASGSIGGELALCQRYYVRFGGNSAYCAIGQGVASATTRANVQMPLPVTLRANPTAVDYSTVSLQAYDGAAQNAATALVISGLVGLNIVGLQVDVASGLTVGSVFRLLTNNSTSGYVGLSAEL